MVEAQSPTLSLNISAASVASHIKVNVKAVAPIAAHCDSVSVRVRSRR